MTRDELRSLKVGQTVYSVFVRYRRGRYNEIEPDYLVADDFRVVAVGEDVAVLACGSKVYFRSAALIFLKSEEADSFTEKVKQEYAICSVADQIG